MLAVLGFLLTFLLGLLVVLLLVPRISIFEKLTISFPLALGILTYLMFLGSPSGIYLNASNLLSALLVFCLPLCFLLLRRKKISGITKPNLKIKKIYMLEIILIILLIIFSCFLFLHNFYWPVRTWDAVTLYDFRAKLIAQTGSIMGFARAVEFDRNYFAHPLFTSLAHAFFRILGKSNPNFIYSLFYLGLILFFYSSSIKKTSRIVALFLTVILATNFYVFYYSTVAYPVIPFAFFYFVSVIFLLRFIEDQDYGLLIVSALMLGFSSWTRYSETFFLVNIFAVIVWGALKERYLAPLIFSFLFFAIREPWGVFVSSVVPQPEALISPIFPSLSEISRSVFNFKRIISLAQFLWRGVISPWGIIFWTFLLAFFLNLKNLKKNFFLNLLIVGNLIVLLVGIYIFSLVYPKWEQVAGSATRTSIFFMPLFLYFIGETAFSKKFFSSQKGIGATGDFFSRIILPLSPLQIFFVGVFSVILIFSLQPNRIKKYYEESTRFLFNHPFISEEEKIRHHWDIVYDIFDLVRKNTPEDATIAIPPKIMPWLTVGNIQVARAFLFPRRLVQGEDEKSLIDSGAQYALIAWGRWKPVPDYMWGWPKEQIEAEWIIYKEEDSAEVVKKLENLVYNPDDPLNKDAWGLIKIRKKER